MKQLLDKFPILNSLEWKGNVFYKNAIGQYNLKRKAAESPLKIVVGSSGVFEKGWIPTDIQYLNLTNPDHWKRFFKKNTIDAILAEHVWEHLTFDEGFIAAKHCYEYLKPDCYLRVAVPDGFHPDPEYIEWVKVNGTGPGSGADDHKVLYNYETFGNLFERAGFQIRLLEYFDRNGKFHYKHWGADTGMIRRSKRYDERNKNGELKYTSLILDAIKTPAQDNNISGC